jgi:hypothetical protein
MDILFYPEMNPGLDYLIGFLLMGLDGVGLLPQGKGILLMVGLSFLFYLVGLFVHIRGIRRLNEEIKLNFLTSVKMYLDNVVYLSKVDRGIVVKFHNGGGMMNMVNNKISIIAESNSVHLRSVKNDYQKYEVDQAYKNMLSNLREDKILIYDVLNMDDGFLKRRYMMEGIKVTVIFYLVEGRGVEFFGSFSSVLDFNEFMIDSNYSIIENRINKIRILFKEAVNDKINV